MTRVRLASLLPVLLLGSVLGLTQASTPASDEGPVVQMTVTPTNP